MLETSDLAELTVVRSILEAAELRCVVIDEESVRMGLARPLSLMFGGPPPKARIQVHAKDAESARELLRETGPDG